MPQRLDDFLGEAPISDAGPVRLDAFLGQSVPSYTPPASPAEYFKTHSNVDPLALETAYSHLGQPNQAAAVQTPEMIARQRMQATNQERGIAGNLTAGALGNYSGIAGGVQRALAGPVGMIFPQAGENMRMAAAQSEAYAPQDGSLAGTAGSLVGGLPAAFVPGGSLINAANTGEQTYENIEARKARGEDISRLDEFANVAGQAGISGLVTKLGQKNITGNLVSRLAPQAAMGTLAGRLAAKGLGGAVFNTAGHLASQGLQAATTDPNTDITAGVGKAALLGAGMDVAGGLLHEYGAAQTPQEKPNVPENQGRPAPTKGEPPVQEAGPTERPQLPQEPRPTEEAGTQPLSSDVEGSEGTTPKTLPELPPEHGQWSSAELKDWADKSGFDTGDATGKLELRNKVGDQLLSQEKALRRTDPLTQAPNTIKYQEDAAKIFKDADTKGEHTALVETDVSGLKVMNTAYGHAAGDDMLRMAAQAMREELRVPPQRSGRSEDYLGSAGYRVGGDEFPAILRNVKTQAEAKVAMDRINANFDKKLAAKFPDLPPEARPFIAYNAEIRPPGDTRPLHDIQKTAEQGVEPYKSAKKAGRQIPEGRTEFLDYLTKRRAEMAAGKGVPETGTNVPEQGTPRLGGGRNAGAVAVPESAEKLFERDIRPAVAKTASNVKSTWDSVNRALGTGLNLKPEDYDTALNLRTSQGRQDLDRTRTEEALKPSRDLLEKMTPAQKTQWVDQVEAIGTSPDKATQPAADLMNKLNKTNIAEGEKYGLNTSKWDENYLGRLFEFPGEAGGTGSRTSIAGPQSFLKGRTFDTYSDALKFVESQGGKPKYDNPLDMALAKQTEIRRSIEARKSLYGEEDKGQVKWVENGTPTPEGMEAKLDDRLAKQDRDVIAPKWVFKKLADMQHLDAQKYMESPEWETQTKTLRPGDDVPEGMVKTGQTKPGQYAANENVAGLFNNLISQGVTKAIPVWDQAVQMKRGVVAANLGLSAVHAVLESVGNAVQSVGRALANVGGGEFDLAAKNLARANPVGQARFGSKIREQAANPAAHPELEPLVQTSQLGGNKFALKSVLDKTDFQKAKEEWAAGNKLGAVPRILKGLYNKMQAPLFDHFIPALRAGAKAAEAESALRRGLTGDELQRHMGRSQEDIDNILGTVIRTNQFQNKLVTDVQDLIFTAPKFTEGTLRFAGASVRDSLAAFKAVAGGKTPVMTPAMYTALAGLMTHVFGATLFQMAYTKATTGVAQRPHALQDYISPRTGRKDDKGHDERISLMSPFSALFSFAKGKGQALTSRIAPIWHAGYNAIQNVDERGVEIRSRTDSPGQQALDTAKYVGKHALPFSVQNIMEGQKPGGSKTLDAKVGAVLGARFGHTPSSKAEQEILDIAAENRRSAPETKQAAARGEKMRGLEEEVREKQPGARQDVVKAARAGDINPTDVATVYKRVAAKPGLRDLIQRDSTSARDLMERVWPKMTPEEQRQNQWMIRGKVGKTETMTPVEKRKWFQQISQDVRAQ